MAGRQPGAPSIQEAVRMRANAETGVASTSRKYQWQLPIATDAEKERASNEFPIVPVPKDPYDDVANIKYRYAQQAAGTNWIVPFEQSDAEYLRRKRDYQEKAEFDTWIMQKYDITNPSENLMLQSIAPELFQRREEVIDSQQALVSAYAKLRLRGAKSLSDLELEWLIETGRLELPKGPIWNPLSWREKQIKGSGLDDEQWNRRRYEFGLFSPLQWLTASHAGQTPSRNRADIAGSGTHFNPTRVPYPVDHYANQWGTEVPYPYAGNNLPFGVGGMGGGTAPNPANAIAGTPVNNFPRPIVQQANNNANPNVQAADQP